MKEWQLKSVQEKRDSSKKSKQVGTTDSKPSHVEYIQMDACEMTFEDDSFDFVLDKGCMDAVRPLIFYITITDVVTW
jgi:hypothetical protein